MIFSALAAVALGGHTPPPQAAAARALPPLLFETRDAEGRPAAILRVAGCELRAAAQTWEYALEEPLIGKVSIFRGARESWLTEIPTYRKLTLRRRGQAAPALTLTLRCGSGAEPEVAAVGPLAATVAPALAQAGFLGGSGSDFGSTAATDGSGALYIVGSTGSSEATFPEILGPDLTWNGGTPFGSGDAFVAKLDPTGTTLLYCGFLGGSGNEGAIALAVDSQGRAVLGGQTESTPAQGFPVTVGPDLIYNGGALDGWIARVSADGASLDYCGYVGGPGGDERIAAIAIGAGDVAAFAGHTDSNAPEFPALLGPSTFQAGGLDAVVGRLAASGAAFEMCGFLGGSGNDFATGIAVAPDGGLVLCGITDSDPSSFPVAVGPSLKRSGSFDAFVAKVAFDPITPSVTIPYCGYLGGAAVDAAGSVAVDALGRAFVCGYTYSSPATFPVKFGPSRQFSGGPSSNEFDAFVARIAADGKKLEFCGYVGGSGFDRANEIALDGSGSVYLCGETNSKPNSAVPFPSAGGLSVSAGAFSNAFLAKIAPSGGALLACGSFGGDGVDAATSCAAGSDGNVHLVGQTQSTEATFPTALGPDLTANGSYDAFIATYSFGSPEPPDTLAIFIQSARLTNSSKPSADRVRALGALEWTALSPDGAVDIATESVTVELGPLAAPVSFTIPAGDPRWKRTGPADAPKRLAWSSPPGSTPRLRLVFDLAKRRFLADVTRCELDNPGSDPIALRITAGNDRGSFLAPWRAKSGTVLVLP